MRAFQLAIAALVALTVLMAIPDFAILVAFVTGDWASR